MTDTKAILFSLGGKFCLKQELKIVRLGSNDEPENLAMKSGRYKSPHNSPLSSA